MSTTNAAPPHLRRLCGAISAGHPVASRFVWTGGIWLLRYALFWLGAIAISAGHPVASRFVWTGGIWLLRYALFWLGAIAISGQVIIRPTELTVDPVTQPHSAEAAR